MKKLHLLPALLKVLCVIILALASAKNLSSQPVKLLSIAHSDAQKVAQHVKMDNSSISGVSSGCRFLIALARAVHPQFKDGCKGKADLSTFSGTLICSGAALLGVGFTQPVKWQTAEDKVKIQTGILSNGHVGLAVNF